MNSKSTQDARNRFLQRAAQALLVSSPAISCHLNISRGAPPIGQKTKANAKPNLDSPLESACTACGSIFLIGWSCSITTSKAKKTKRRLPRVETSSSEQNLRTVRCHRCDAVNQIPIFKRPRRTIKPTLLVIGETQPMLDAPTVLATDVSSSNTDVPSKASPAPNNARVAEQAARRRARNKKQSLQSLIAVQNLSVPTINKGPSLDLMDFLKM